MEDCQPADVFTENPIYMPLGLFNRGVITTMKVIAGFVTIRLRWLLNTEKTVTHCLLFILNQSICITYFCTGRYSQSHHKFTNRYFIYWPIKSLTTNHLTLKMASAQVAEKSVTKDSPSQEFNHPDDQILKVIYYCIKVGGGVWSPLLSQLPLPMYQRIKQIF